MRVGGYRLRYGSAPGLRFADVAQPTLPDAPETTSFHASADAALRQIYLNDTLGDCVIAARNHRIGLLTGAATGKRSSRSRRRSSRSTSASGTTSSATRRPTRAAT